MTISNPLYGQPNTYSADILGDGVLIPEYADNPNILPGMTFSAVISDSGTDYPVSGRLKNNVGRGYSPLDGYGFINAEQAVNATLPAPGVVSRKVHGSAGTFDIPLPINGTAGIECRAPGPNGSYQLIFTFDRMVATPGGASVTQGSATASANPTVGPGPNQVTVNLTGVGNAQHLIVTLGNVQDSSGNAFTALAARMDVLIGDTTGNGSVNSSDIAQTQAQSGQVVTTGNFREDVTANGTINSSDIGLVQSKSGTALP